MRLHDRFEWDEEKAELNLRKHGITFDAAAEVLLDDDADRWHWVRFDEAHSTGEDRWNTVASHPARRWLVLSIVWAARSGVTRIISARKAKRLERRQYEEQVLRNEG